MMMRARAEKFVTTVSRAGARAPATALKTYIPAAVVRTLKIQSGDVIEWRLEGETVTVKVHKPNSHTK